MLRSLGIRWVTLFNTQILRAALGRLHGAMLPMCSRTKVPFLRFERTFGMKRFILSRFVKRRWQVVSQKVKEHENTLPKAVELRPKKYLNNVIEQEHRNIKRIVKPMMGFQSFNTARRTWSGIEAMNMIPKGQVNGIEQGSSVSQARSLSKNSLG